MADEWTISVRRAYDTAQPADGHRVLVDRPWPHQLDEASARIDQWCPDIAPSTELATWYGQDPTRFSAFREQYLTELNNCAHAGALAGLRTRTGARLTLLTGTRDLRLSHARVLAERLTWSRAVLGPTITHVHLDASAWRAERSSDDASPPGRVRRQSSTLTRPAEGLPGPLCV